MFFLIAFGWVVGCYVNVGIVKSKSNLTDNFPSSQLYFQISLKTTIIMFSKSNQFFSELSTLMFENIGQK